MPRKGSHPKDWELEQAFDAVATLEELINSPPFKDASDEHGHSVTAGTRIPQWLYRKVVKLKEFPGSPYELVSDVLRDSVYLGLRIQHLRYSIAADWDVETKLAAITDAAGASGRIRSRLEELEGSLEELCMEGDESQAAERLKEYILASAELESMWYRKKIFSFIKASKTIQRVLQLCPRYIQELASREAR